MHDITGPLLQPLGMGPLETVAKGTEMGREKGRQDVGEKNNPDLVESFGQTSAEKVEGHVS